MLDSIADDQQVFTIYIKICMYLLFNVKLTIGELFQI
jgi:hypothetical protein